MSAAPKILILAIATAGFMGLIAGKEALLSGFPDYETPPEGVLDIIASILGTIWGTVAFFFNVVTFNVPGAPWYVRLPIAALIGGGLLWSLATLIRGGGGD